MLIPPKYILTSKTTQLLQTIEASKEVINSVDIPKEIELNIRRASILKSSLFSARIEGNTLTLEDLPKTASKDQRRQEVMNILKAFNWIDQRGTSKDITSKDILALHRLTMNGLINGENLGSCRTEVSAIYNKAGIAIYLPPRPALINGLVSKLIIFLNSTKEQFVPIRACLAHYAFEKIHPFLDGNGRVGRLLLQMILAKNGYGMKGLSSLEEYLDRHRTEYYASLEAPEKEVSEYLEFMLEGIAATSLQAKRQVLEKRSMDALDYLLPRRAEIFRIIRDQRLIKFDTIRRRFLAVSERTLRYDLKQLADAGLIRKRGTTNGVYYEAKTSEV